MVDDEVNWTIDMEGNIEPLNLEILLRNGREVFFIHEYHYKDKPPERARII